MDDDQFPIDDLPQEEVFFIDIDRMNEDSEKDAKDMVEIASSLILDESFKKEHPKVQKRIALEVETLRGLIKMRKADEEAHDALLKAISENKSNASLYRSMAEIQKTSIAVTNKIHDTMDRLGEICKGFQIDTPLQDGEQPEQAPETKFHRGSKEFIKQMMEEDN